MASTALLTTKDGRKYYRIFVSRGYGNAPYTTRWYVPDGLSQKYIDRQLNQAIREFETKCKNGEILSRKELKEQKETEAKEKAKIRTLKQYSEQIFMPNLCVTCSRQTKSSYNYNFKNHIYPVLGEYKISEITSEQISSLLLSLQSKNGLKCASVIKVYTIINSLFKQAYMSHLIDRNPMDFVNRPRPTKAEGKESHIKSYTEKEIKYILECVDNEPLIWKTFINLMICTGCRRAEILGIEWDSIDFNEGTINIKQSLCYTPEKGVYVDTTKNGKSRVVFINDKCINLLSELKKYYLVHNKKIGITSKRKYVFTQEDGETPIHPDSPTRKFKQLEKKYGIEDFHPHKLRHSFASIAITNGADIASISELLGHSDKGVTLRMYTHADKEAQKKASQIFENAIGRLQA